MTALEVIIALNHVCINGVSQQGGMTNVTRNKHLFQLNALSGIKSLGKYDVKFIHYGH